MGLKRRVSVCMAPSVELSTQEASHMGNVIESMIARDYLHETRNWKPNPLLPLPQTIGEFFDTGNLSYYKQRLTNRHPLEVSRTALKRNDLKIPDISTWKGERRERVAGVSIVRDEVERNEHYEIKPDHDDGRRKGIDKLEQITKDNRELYGVPSRLSSGYRRGTWYPSEAQDGMPPPRTRKIRFSDNAGRLKSLWHKLARWTKHLLRAGLGVEVVDFYVEVARREAGLLQYSICVDLELDDDATRAFENEVAVAVVGLIYVYLTQALAGASEELVRRFVNGLKRIGTAGTPAQPAPDPKVPRIRQALADEQAFRTTYDGLVEEIKPQFAHLRATLYSRQMALPGDEFIVACDEPYFLQEIDLPRREHVARQVKLMQLVANAPLSYPSSITVSRSGALTVDAALRYAGTAAADAGRWIEAHQTEILVGIAVVVVVTALVAFVLLSGGLGAPAAVGVAGTMAEGAVIGEAAVTTGVATSTAGATIVAGETGGLAVGVGAAELTPAQLTILRWGLAARQAQSAAALGTLTQQATLTDAMLVGGTSGATAAPSAANAVGLLGAAAMAPSGAPDPDFADAMQLGLYGALGQHLLKAGPALAGVSLRQLVARDAAPGAGAARSGLTGNIGSLYLLKARTHGLAKREVALEQGFEWAKYSDSLKQQSDIGQAAAPTRLRYLGTIIAG